MSDVYCRACKDSGAIGDFSAAASDDASSGGEIIDDIDSPACLVNITPKHRRGGQLKKPRNLLTVESELEIPNGKELIKHEKKSSTNNQLKKKTNNTSSSCCSSSSSSNCKKKSTPQSTPNKLSTTQCQNNNKKIEEYEYADDAIAFNADLSADICKMGILNENESKLMIRVQGKEELPARQTNANSNVKNLNKYPSVIDNKCSSPNNRTKLNRNKNSDIVLEPNIEIIDQNTKLKDFTRKFGKIIPKNNLSRDDDHNGNDGSRDNRLNRNYSTLPKMKKTGSASAPYERPMKKIPMRTTPDGTNIYYWCDLSKKMLKGYFALINFFNLYIFAIHV